MNQISTTLGVNTGDLVLPSTPSTHIWPSYLPLKFFLGAKDLRRFLLQLYTIFINI